MTFLNVYEIFSNQYEIIKVTFSKYFIDYSVLANTTYYYKISANNSHYGERNFSNEISIYVLVLPLETTTPTSNTEPSIVVKTSFFAIEGFFISLILLVTISIIRRPKLK